MKWLLTIGLLLAAPLVHAKGEPAYLEVKDFSCGVDTYHDPLSLNDCYVQDALNVYFDKDAPIVKRGGYTLSFSTKAYSYSGQWSYTDNSGNIWMIVRSSDQISATTGVGTSQFNIRVATVSANNVVSEQSAFGNAYFVDQTQGVYYWNGTSTTYVASSPLGSLIAEYHNRIWVAGLAAPYGSRVQGSKYLDGTTWSTSAPTLTTDPVSLIVSLADNYDITSCMFSGYNDSLYIFENTHINQLTGFDSTNFNVAQIGKEVGCIQQGSIQQFQGGLVFASLRGFEFFDGYTATRVSDAVKDKVDPSTLNSSFGQNSWVQQTAADWNAGTSNEFNVLSSTIATPALVLSTNSITENSSTKWNSGTASNVSVFTSSIVLNTNNSGNISDGGFESSIGAGTFSARWTKSGSLFLSPDGSYATDHCGTKGPDSGSYFFIMGEATGLGSPQLHARLMSTDLSQTYSDLSVGWTTTNCAYTTKTISSTGYVGKRFRLQFYEAVSGSYLVTTESYILGGDITFRYASDTTFTDTNRDYFIDQILLGSSTISSGNFTSQAIDTTHTKNYAQFQTTATLNTEAINTVLQSAVGSGGPFYDITTTQNVSAASNRYLRYISTFTVSGTQDALSYLSSVSMQTTTSSGTWASPSHNISTATAFGNLTVTQTLGGGTIAYAVCQSTVSTMAGKLCSSISANAQITVSTNIFVQVIATFTVTAATNTPTLNSVTVNWYTGTRKPPMASTVFDNRYWVSLTTDTADSINDATLVLSKGPVWTIFDIKAGAFVVWKNSLYFADAQSSGGAYQLEQGYNDNGAAMNSFVRTKAYAPRGIISDKFFEELWVVAQNGGHYPITTSYTIDQSTSSFTLGTLYMDEVPGAMISRLSLPISASYQNFGKLIDFTFQENTVDAPFKLFGGTLRYRARPPI